MSRESSARPQSKKRLQLHVEAVDHEFMYRMTSFYWSETGNIKAPSREEIDL